MNMVQSNFSVEKLQRIVREIAPSCLLQDLDSQRSFACSAINHELDYLDLSLILAAENHDCLEQLADSFASCNEALSLDVLQHWLANQWSNQLKSYLESLNPIRQKRIRHSLQLYIERCIGGIPGRMPRPFDAPQPIWDETLRRMQSVAFNKSWQKLARHLHSPKIFPLPSIHEPICQSWKTRVIQAMFLESLVSQKHSPLLNLSRVYRPYLQSLDLHGKMELTDSELSVFVDHLPDLTSIHLDHCDQAASLCAQAINRRIKDLKKLWIDRCSSLNLREISFKEAQQLQTLGIRDMQLHELPLSWSQMSNLRELDLTESDFTDSHITKMAPCPQIKKLKLKHCLEVAHLGVELLGRAMPNLQYLDLSLCPGVHSKALQELPRSIQHLALNWCEAIDDRSLELLNSSNFRLKGLLLAHCNQISDQGAEWISEHLELENLDLSFCRRLGPDGLQICLSKLSRLRNLSLKGLLVIDSHWDLLARLPLETFSMPKFTMPALALRLPSNQLRRLDMGSCLHWSSADFSRFLASPICNKLEQLFIDDASFFDDACLDSLCNLTHLKHLRIWGKDQWPQLFINGFQRLSSIANLERLELSYSGQCDIHSLKQMLYQCPKLHTLELGPIYKITQEEILQLQNELPWILIRGYGYGTMGTF